MKKRLSSNILNFNNLNIEVNTKVNLYDLIEEDKSIAYITDNYPIDTSTLGKQTLSIKVVKNDIIHNISFEINIKDNQKPEIIGENLVTVNIGTEIDLLNNAKVKDNSNENIELTIKGDYDINKEGEYQLKYYAKDSSGNINTKDFVLKVVSLKNAPISYNNFKDYKDGEYITTTGHTLTINNGIAYIDNYIIVNKTYKLPSSYKPTNPYSGTIASDSCTNCIDKETMEAFKIMEADARSIGLNIYISSGYRSYNRQDTLFKNYSSRDGISAADKYSARAGHSEHQSGFCFDLNSIDDSFATTNEGKWIDNNAYLYGFIIRYPKGKEEITGYQYESWHLRYVGKELAKKLYNDGNWLTMEEYFGISSKYN